MSSFAPLSTEAVHDPVQALRQATQARHALLDSLLPLGHAGAGLDDYLNHVRVMRDWLAGLSPCLAATGWGAGGLDAACRDLGQSVPAASPSRVAADGRAWGTAYVVEGSRLGGRVLLTRLRKAGVDHPLHFLQGEGSGTGARWARFLAALRAALRTPADTDAACAGACAAFDDLLARMRDAGLVAHAAHATHADQEAL